MGGALKADVEAEAAFGAFANLESLLCLGDIDAEGLLTVGVFACRDYCVEVLNVEPGRRRNLDRVDGRRCGQLLKSVRAAEHQGGVDGGNSQRCVQLVEVRFSGGELIGKKIGEGDDARGSVLHEGRSDGGAATAATEEADADSGVGFISESCA
jgi:hypothetical protein